MTGGHFEIMARLALGQLDMVWPVQKQTSPFGAQGFDDFAGSGFALSAQARPQPPTVSPTATRDFGTTLPASATAEAAPFEPAASRAARLQSEAADTVDPPAYGPDHPAGMAGERAGQARSASSAPKRSEPQSLADPAPLPRDAVEQVIPAAEDRTSQSISEAIAQGTQLAADDAPQWRAAMPSLPRPGSAIEVPGRTTSRGREEQPHPGADSGPARSLPPDQPGVGRSVPNPEPTDLRTGSTVTPRSDGGAPVTDDVGQAAPLLRGAAEQIGEAQARPPAAEILASDAPTAFPSVAPARDSVATQRQQDARAIAGPASPRDSGRAAAGASAATRKAGAMPGASLLPKLGHRDIPAGGGVSASFAQAAGEAAPAGGWVTLATDGAYGSKVGLLNRTTLAASISGPVLGKAARVAGQVIADLDPLALTPSKHPASEIRAGRRIRLGVVGALPPAPQALVGTTTLDFAPPASPPGPHTPLLSASSIGGGFGIPPAVQRRAASHDAGGLSVGAVRSPSSFVSIGFAGPVAGAGSLAEVRPSVAVPTTMLAFSAAVAEHRRDAMRDGCAESAGLARPVGIERSDTERGRSTSAVEQFANRQSQPVPPLDGTTWTPNASGGFQADPERTTADEGSFDAPPVAENVLSMVAPTVRHTAEPLPTGRALAPSDDAFPGPAPAPEPALLTSSDRPPAVAGATFWTLPALALGDAVEAHFQEPLTRFALRLASPVVGYRGSFEVSSTAIASSNDHNISSAPTAFSPDSRSPLSWLSAAPLQTATGLAAGTPPAQRKFIVSPLSSPGSGDDGRIVTNRPARSIGEAAVCSDDQFVVSTAKPPAAAIAVTEWTPTGRSKTAGQTADPTADRFVSRTAQTDDSSNAVRHQGGGWSGNGPSRIPDLPAPFAAAPPHRLPTDYRLGVQPTDTNLRAVQPLAAIASSPQSAANIVEWTLPLGFGQSQRTDTIDPPVDPSAPRASAPVPNVSLGVNAAANDTVPAGTKALPVLDHLILPTIKPALLSGHPRFPLTREATAAQFGAEWAQRAGVPNAAAPVSPATPYTPVQRRQAGPDGGNALGPAAPLDAAPAVVGANTALQGRSQDVPEAPLRPGMTGFSNDTPRPSNVPPPPIGQAPAIGLSLERTDNRLPESATPRAFRRHPPPPAADQVSVQVAASPESETATASLPHPSGGVMIAGIEAAAERDLVRPQIDPNPAVIAPEGLFVPLSQASQPSQSRSPAAGRPHFMSFASRTSGWTSPLDRQTLDSDAVDHAPIEDLPKGTVQAFRGAVVPQNALGRAADVAGTMMGAAPVVAAAVAAATGATHPQHRHAAANPLGGPTVASPPRQPLPSPEAGPSDVIHGPAPVPQIRPAGERAAVWGQSTTTQMGAGTQLAQISSRDRHYAQTDPHAADATSRRANSAGSVAATARAAPPSGWNGDRRKVDPRSSRQIATSACWTADPQRAPVSIPAGRMLSDGLDGRDAPVLGWSIGSSGVGANTTSAAFEKSGSLGVLPEQVVNAVRSAAHIRVSVAVASPSISIASPPEHAVVQAYGLAPDRPTFVPPSFKVPIPRAAEYAGPATGPGQKQAAQSPADATGGFDRVPGIRRATSADGTSNQTAQPVQALPAAPADPTPRPAAGALHVGGSLETAMSPAGSRLAAGSASAGASAIADPRVADMRTQGGSSAGLLTDAIGVVLAHPDATHRRSSSVSEVGDPAQIAVAAFAPPYSNRAADALLAVETAMTAAMPATAGKQVLAPTALRSHPSPAAAVEGVSQPVAPRPVSATALVQRPQQPGSSGSFPVSTPSRPRPSEPSRQRGGGAAPEPIVRINIGRIRVVSAPATPGPRFARPVPAMGLARYTQLRRDGTR